MCSTAWKRRESLTCPMLFTFSVWALFSSPEYAMICSISQRCGTIIRCERREICHPISFGILGCCKHLCQSLILQRSYKLRTSRIQTVDSEHGVIVPEISCPLSPEDLATLQNQVNPAAESTCFGYDIYLQARELALNLMS